MTSHHPHHHNIGNFYASNNTTPIEYHDHEDFPPKDRCGYKDPKFPYSLTDITQDLRIFIIIHGILMVWVFVFLIPISVFPVLWNSIGPNELVGRLLVPKWLKIHIDVNRPVFPLMTISIACVMYTKHECRTKVLKNSSCGFYNEFHEVLGIATYLIYTFHFFIGFFTHNALHNDVFRSLRFCHKLSHSLGYSLSIPLIAMAKLSTESGGKRYLYIVPYLYFFFVQVGIFIRMKFAAFGALQWHMIQEAQIASENKGIMLRTSQWLWNFGEPGAEYNSQVIDLKPQRTHRRIRLPQYLATYRFYWKKILIVCVGVAVMMSVHLGMLYTGIYLSSPNYLPTLNTLGDFRANWSLLKVYAL